MLSSVNFAQPDVTLKLDLSGVIQQASLCNAIADEGIDDWVGRPWADTVAEDGNAQVQQMVADARTIGVSSFHQVRQRFPSGLVIAVEYATVRLGENDGLLAIGRSLEAVSELRSRLIAAQQSMERDYWKLREVETRYRLLFDASTQPVLLISADDMRIIEANPAAIRALGVASDRALLPEISAAQRDVFHAMLARVREQGKAPGVVMHLGPDRQPWLVRAYSIAAEPAAVFVLQLSPAGTTPPKLVDTGSSVNVEDLLANLPDGFVVVDAEGTILRTNRAFRELLSQPVETALLGQRLGRFLTQPGADAGALLGSVQRQGTVRNFKTTLQNERGRDTEVEISAAGSSEQNPRYIGLLLRRSLSSGETPERQDLLPQPDLIGKLPLREIVQAKVALVERRCIEAALELANGNRSAAADLLGLSRQSLYVKLSRYSFDIEEPGHSPKND